MTYKIGDITMDTDFYEVARNGEEINLSLTEFKIFEEIVKAEGRPLSHEKLMEKIGKDPSHTEKNQINVILNSIRKKIGDKDKKIIKTFAGVGYKINTDLL